MSFKFVNACLLTLFNFLAVTLPFTVNSKLYFFRLICFEDVDTKAECSFEGKNYEVFECSSERAACRTGLERSTFSSCEWCHVLGPAEDRGQFERLENVFFSESGWCNNPVAVAYSTLCEVDENFLECVPGIRENSEISTRIDSFPLEDGSSRKYQDLHCIATDLNTDSAACSLTLRDLMSFTAPKNLIVVKQDAIVSNGCWWTDGHIEVGGGDSISYTPLGSKLFLICRRGYFFCQIRAIDA